MRIEAIELYRVGLFLQRRRIGPLADGLNILAAPNEQGKSTLVRAGARCLFDRHTSKSDEIKALQPAGTDLAPEITVEFRAGPGRFRLSKGFLVSPESLLREWREVRAAFRGHERCCVTAA
jgi:hypothetical protein